MKDNGRAICKMDTVLKLGLMAQDTKVITRKARNMVKVKLFKRFLGNNSSLGNYLWADGSRYIGNWQENKISGFVIISISFQKILISTTREHTAG